MFHRRRTQDIDQSNCDRNFSHYVRSGSGVVAMAGLPRSDRGAEIHHAPPGTPLRRTSDGKESQQQALGRWRARIGLNKSERSYARSCPSAEWQEWVDTLHHAPRNPAARVGPWTVNQK